MDEAKNYGNEKTCVIGQLGPTAHNVALSLRAPMLIVGMAANIIRKARLRTENRLMAVSSQKRFRITVAMPMLQHPCRGSIGA